MLLSDSPYDSIDSIRAGTPVTSSQSEKSGGWQHHLSTTSTVRQTRGSRWGISQNGKVRRRTLISCSKTRSNVACRLSTVGLDRQAQPRRCSCSCHLTVPRKFKVESHRPFCLSRDTMTNMSASLVTEVSLVQTPRGSRTAERANLLPHPDPRHHDHDNKEGIHFLVDEGNIGKVYDTHSGPTG